MRFLWPSDGIKHYLLLAIRNNNNYNDNLLLSQTTVISTDILRPRLRKKNEQEFTDRR